MILVDTSVWVSHFKGMKSARALADLLPEDLVLCHPWVIGELALGGLAAEPRELLASLPLAVLAQDDEVLRLIDDHHLVGRGVGWVDAQLLAAALLSGASVWSLDRSLAAAAEDLGLEGGAP